MKAENFSDGDLVVYPAHGVGKLVAIETQHVAGCELKVFVIAFEKNRMTLRLPMAKAREAGLRALSSDIDIEDAYKTLKKKFSVKKTIWARRAQEYELKISSGSLTAIAEVLRELYRKEDQPEQSYSERQIYQSAMQRLAAEVSAVSRCDETEVVKTVEDILSAA